MGSLVSSVVMNINIISDTVAEIAAEGIIINATSDALDILGNAYYGEFEKIILHEKNIIPEFFDLKTKLAGDILQKFSNYRMKLAIVGKFDSDSKSLADFIFESNKLGTILFVNSVEEAIIKLSR